MGGITSSIRGRFPPPPTFMEKDLPLLHGRVSIITGGYSGCEFELVEMLFQAGGKTYIAGRDEGQTKRTIGEILQTRGATDTTGVAGL